MGAALLPLERPLGHRVQTRPAATFRIGFLEIVFVFLFIDLFDNIGTLVAWASGPISSTRRTRSARQPILLSDATATIVGSLTGTSTW